VTRVAVIGASIGGLIAAAELRRREIAVTIVERGKTVGGLYGKVDTPFGPQELGMHVLYVDDAQYQHLCSIFGAGAFEVWTGASVDIGATYNFGRACYDSVYPDVRSLPAASAILDEIVRDGGKDGEAPNALAEVIRRFGEQAGRTIVAPILGKLWRVAPDQLTREAIHCFFDLRRIIACDKARADVLKQDPRLDAVLGNPLQSQPRGAVYGGRMAVRFKQGATDLAPRVDDWLRRDGIEIQFERHVAISDHHLLLEGQPVDRSFEGCIVATPVASLAPEVNTTLDQLELSIYYFKLAERLVDRVPAYYVLCQQADLEAARIVNYSAYHHDRDPTDPEVVAVEVVHPVGAPPAEATIARELTLVVPAATIDATYRLPRSLRVPCPTLNNGRRLDALVQGMDATYPSSSLFFTGMRTDKGIFFSHHTIGLGHDAAMECARRLS